MLKKRRLSQSEIDYMLDQFKMAMSKNGMVTMILKTLLG